ncbi:hypothetical protein [Hymenobacter ruricola]|uniref:DUF2029 domain-containing protein n=1 Tax=Hymenobacter ruricola TaxID=2791023 RepID=A0ABS0I9T9_9BACT|nr:hypothetical protein [Hymenobacter ruricola]MBF9223737.1 hypothetical protein [Hymenobacter ruricola]
MRLLRFFVQARPRQWGWLWLLGCWLAVWAELELLTDSRNYYGPMWSPVLLLAAGAVLCGCALGFWLRRPAVAPAAEAVLRRVPVAGLLLLLGGGWVLSVQAPAVATRPVSLNYSDVIVILQTYVSRFRSGEVVYRYLTNLSYPLFPNHLPMQWLPYVPADALGIDYRWWAMGLLLLLGFGAYQLVLVRQPLSWLEFGLKALLPAYFVVRLIQANPDIYSLTCEPTIICYYCLLAASVLGRSAGLQATALVLCLMSRYSVVFWVPFFLWVLWREVSPRHALVVAGLTGAGILGVYVVPFLSHDWTIFSHALAEYRIATLGEWSRSSGTDLPVHVFGGTGVASWFYTYGPESISERITLLQRTHVVVSAGVVALVAWLYYRLRHRLDYRLAALIGLKLYLATFYSFLQIPYLYLTSLSLFISLFVVMTVGFRRAPEAPTAVAGHA